MSKTIATKIKRGSLIQNALENVKRKSFEVIQGELRQVLKKRAGIYALYKDGKVLKVGLTTRLYRRLKNIRVQRKCIGTLSVFLL